MIKDDYMKLFDYILENYENLMDDDNITLDFLLQLRLYVKGKRLDDCFMTDKCVEIIIGNFLKYGKVFNEDTPQIILDNEDCINKAINNDIYSVNYLKDYEFNLDKFKIILDNDYILSMDSPLYLKKNFDVALKSIKLDCFSADDICYESFNDDERKLFILELLKSNYILNSRSPECLRNNRDIVFHSIEKDVNSYQYSFVYFYKDYDVFKYLLDNNYEFNEDDIKYLKLIPLSFITSSDILYKVFDLLDIYVEDSNDYKMLFTSLYYNLLNTYPTIKSFNEIIDYLCNRDWNEYRNKNINSFSNIYSKIIAIIKNNDSYEKFEEEFMFLNNKISSVLGDKYDLFLNAIKEYYYLYHSGELDKSKLENSSFIISKFSSLYVSMQKEQYKANRRESFYVKLMNYFIPKLDNKVIKNRILQYVRKSIFLTKYKNGDTKILDLLDNLSFKYVNLYGSWISDVIKNYLDNNNTNLRNIINCPDGYNDYLKYIEALKLLNRLNKGYIKYNDQELTYYRDVIIYDSVNLVYKYNGEIYFDIEECKNFYNKEMVFQKFIKEVMLYINKIEVDANTFNNYLKKINVCDFVKDLPFSDDYYEFDSNMLKDYKFELFVSRCVCKSKPLCNMDNYDFVAMYNILDYNNLIWLWLLNDCLEIQCLLSKYYIKMSALIDMFNNIDKIKLLSSYLNIDYRDYGSLSLLYDISNYTDNRIINLINPDVIKELCSSMDYTGGHSKKEIIKISGDLVCQMAKRLESTVPYVDGYYNGYHYSMYDNLEDDVLLTGAYVDSCLKVCGNDNDFLHYCMIDKNGFIIKITNRSGNFIGRAAGFRNGNFIYINQLRTIYDKGGTGYCGIFDSERDELVKVLIKACSDIVNASQNNPNEDTKIDYAFVIQRYAFSDYPADFELSKKIHDIIGEEPIDISTDDWNYFYNNTQNILETEEDGCFSTDYSDYNLICIASSKDINSDDLKIGDVDSLYKRPRNKLIISSVVTNDIVRKINKIRAIYSYYHDDKYSDVTILDNSLVIIGDNWYLVYNNEKIDYLIQEFDERAKREFEVVKDLLLEYKNDKCVIEKIKHLI